jgi:predicted transposase YbfD/YdcC
MGSYWSIENSLHWALDIGFGEDESRIHKEQGPEKMASLRRIALSLPLPRKKAP